MTSHPTVSVARKAQTLVHIALIAVFSLIFLVAIQVRTDLAVGWVDSAIYHSLFLNKHEMVTRFGDIYFAARWVWVFIGETLFSLLPHARASFVLTYLTTVALGISSYFVFRNFISPAAAAIAALTGACNLQVVQTASAGYVSVLAITLFLCGAAAAMASYRHMQARTMVTAGICYFLATVTHPFVLLIGGLLHLTITLRYWRRGVEFAAVVRHETLMLLGQAIAFATTVLVFLYYGLGPLKVYQAMATTTSHSVKQSIGLLFRKDLANLVYDMGGIAMIAAGVVAIAVRLTLQGGQWRSLGDRQIQAMLMLLLPLAVMVFWDFVVGGATLHYAFYQVMLYPLAALQIGVLLDRNITVRRGRTIVLVLFLAAMLILVVVTLRIFDSGYNLENALAAVGAIWGLSAILLLIEALLGQKRNKALMASTVLVFAGMTALACNLTRYGLMAHDPQGGTPGINVVTWAQSKAREHSAPTAPLFVAYHRPDYPLENSNVVRNDRWLFIFQNKRSFFTIFDTIAGVSLWGRGLVAFDSQAVSLEAAKKMLETVQPVSVLVLYTDIDRRPALRKAAEKTGLSVVERETGTYNEGGFKFSYAILGLSASQHSDKPPQQ